MPVVRLQQRGPAETPILAQRDDSAQIIAQAVERAGAQVSEKSFEISDMLITKQARLDNANIRADLAQEFQQIAHEEKIRGTRLDPAVGETGQVAKDAGAHGWQTYAQRVKERQAQALTAARERFSNNRGVDMFNEWQPGFEAEARQQAVDNAFALQKEAYRATSEETERKISLGADVQGVLDGRKEAAARKSLETGQSVQADLNGVLRESIGRSVATARKLYRTDVGAFSLEELQSREQSFIPVAARNSADAFIDADPNNAVINISQGGLKGFLPEGEITGYLEKARVKALELDQSLLDAQMGAADAVLRGPDDAGDYFSRVLGQIDILKSMRNQYLPKSAENPNGGQKAELLQAGIMDQGQLQTGRLQPLQIKIEQMKRHLDVYMLGQHIRQGRVATGGPLDATTVEAANIHGQETIAKVQGRLASGEYNMNQAVGALDKLVTQFGFMPAPVTKFLDSQFRGDARQITMAARLVNGLLNKNAALLETGSATGGPETAESFEQFQQQDVDNARILRGLTGKQINMAVTLQTLLDANVNEAQAIEAVRKMQGTTETKPILEQYQSAYEKGTDKRDLGGLIKNEINSFWTNDPDIPAGMIADGQTLFRAAYIENGGVEKAALRAATAQLQRVWGKTDIGNDGDNHWVKFAPAKMYGPDGGADPSWVRAQLITNLAQRMPDPQSVDLDRIELVAVPDPDDPTGKPAYLIMESGRESFFPKPLLDKTLNGMVFKPDWKSSPDAEQLTILNDLGRAKDQKERARLIDLWKETARAKSAGVKGRVLNPLIPGVTP